MRSALVRSVNPKYVHLMPVARRRYRWHPGKFIRNVLAAIATLLACFIFGLIFWAGIARADVGHPEFVATRDNALAQQLALVVHNEARGEPWDGKVAVAAVILNRTRDPGFPGDIYGVINSPGQFVSRGGVRPSPECVAAAQAALAGEDPTDGALYFYADWSRCDWIRTRPVTAKIGGHTFAK